MRRFACVTVAALLVGAAGCGGSKKADLPADAKQEIGKPVILDPAAKTKAEKSKGSGLPAD